MTTSATRTTTSTASRRWIWGLLLLVGLDSAAAAAEDSLLSAPIRQRLKKSSRSFEQQRQLIECDDYEDTVVFQILLDDAAVTETSWTFTCDKTDVASMTKVTTLYWNVTEVTTKSSWDSSMACVPKDVDQCVLTVFDSAGDGLYNGWFAMYKEAALVGIYDSWSVPDGYSAFEICFGPTCDNGGGLEDNEHDDYYYTDDYATIEELENNVDLCEDDENLVTLEFLLDTAPLESGWTLVCNLDNVIWNVPPGSYDNNDANVWITQHACVAADVAYCELTVLDTAGNGLDETGYYSLKVGAETIYATTYDMATVFSSAVHCFGERCDECQGHLLQMDIGLDEAPFDNHIGLVCSGGQVMWNIEPDSDDVFGTLNLEFCMPKDVCCKISVSDFGNNGIRGGYFHFRKDGDFKFVYDGSDTLQCFTHWSLLVEGDDFTGVCNDKAVEAGR